MPETIGQRLKREREARYLSLEKASEETRIRAVFLQALENDDYSVMPSAAQGRGFLRNYADYLHLDIDKLIAEIQRNPMPPAEVSGPLPQVNLAETDLPPLTEEKDEKNAPPFWTRILGRRPKANSAPEAAQENQPAGENPPDGGDQPEVWKEAPRGLWRRASFWLGNKPDGQGQAGEGVIPVAEQKDEIPAEPPRPETPADLIMTEIGMKLHERREMLSLTPEEVERHTRLRAVFVRALEEGAFEKLPSTVQTRGMLANYAGFLGLDADEVLLRYADVLQARRREKYAETPREKVQTQVKPSIPLLRTFVAGDLIFGMVMIAVILALAVWGVGRIVRSQEEERSQPTVPPFVDVIGGSLPTPSPELTFMAVDDPSAATPAGSEILLTPEVISSPSDANVVVSVFALERVFVRISVDGKMAFEGRMAPRETKVFEAENQVVILTGDGSALRITYNGADLGLMGGQGEVVNRVYLVSGVATPTATLSPTPTNTPLTIPTFTPTATPTGTDAP